MPPARVPVTPVSTVMPPKRMSAPGRWKICLMALGAQNANAPVTNVYSEVACREQEGGPPEGTPGGRGGHKLRSYARYSTVSLWDCNDTVAAGRLWKCQAGVPDDSWRLCSRPPPLKKKKVAEVLTVDVAHVDWVAHELCEVGSQRGFPGGRRWCTRGRRGHHPCLGCCLRGGCWNAGGAPVGDSQGKGAWSAWARCTWGWCVGVGARQLPLCLKA